MRKLQDYVAEEVSAVLEAAGYTAEDAAADNQANGAGGEAASEEPEFAVPVVYALDGDSLVVSVPAKELKANKSFPIASLQLLKFSARRIPENKDIFLCPTAPAHSSISTIKSFMPKGMTCRSTGMTGHST